MFVRSHQKDDGYSTLETEGDLPDTEAGPGTFGEGGLKPPFEGGLSPPLSPYEGPSPSPPRKREEYTLCAAQSALR